MESGPYRRQGELGGVEVNGSRVVQRWIGLGAHALCPTHAAWHRLYALGYTSLALLTSSPAVSDVHVETCPWMRWTASSTHSKAQTVRVTVVVIVAPKTLYLVERFPSWRRRMKINTRSCCLLVPFEARSANRTMKSICLEIEL